MAATKYYLDSSATLLAGVEKHLDLYVPMAQNKPGINFVIAQARGMLQGAVVYITTCRAWDNGVGLTMAIGKGLTADVSRSVDVQPKSPDKLMVEHLSEVNEVYDKLMQRVQEIRDRINKL